MFTFFPSWLQRVLSGEIFELVEPNSASSFIYRDGLSKKQSPSKLKTCYGDSFSSSKPLLKVKDDKDMKKKSSGATGFDAKATIRVKVRMTKQEAARLLSKCKDGGVLEFRDVARELVALPKDRVIVAFPCPGSNAALDSIPEEY
ncbi:hypothetical protein QQP08_011382 [Theobroma cacao]|nr:hypothetical protein QQP08_011382 [Theobroma cacao]